MIVMALQCTISLLNYRCYHKETLGIPRPLISDPRRRWREVHHAESMSSPCHAAFDLLFFKHISVLLVLLWWRLCTSPVDLLTAVWHQSAVWDGRSLKAAVYLKMPSITDSQGTRGSLECRGCVKVVCMFQGHTVHVTMFWAMTFDPLPHRCPPCRPANSCPMCRSDPESLTLSCLHPSPYNTPLLYTPTDTRKSLWGAFSFALVLFRHCLPNADVRLHAAVQAKSKLGQEVEGFNDLEIRCAVSQ